MNDEYLKKLYSYLGAQDSEYHKRTTYDDFKSKMGSEDYSTKVHGYIKGIDSEFRSLEDFNSKIKKKSDWGSTLGSGSSASQKTERKATKEIAKTKDLRNVADKGSEIFTGYPGKEKNQYEFSNGNWYELNPEVEKTIKKSKESYVPVGGLGESYGGGMFVNPSGAGQDFATPGTSKNSLDAIKNVPKKRIIEDDARIKALNKQFGKNASLDADYETFGDYDNSPEKKDNKYRIKNNSWERLVPGATEWSLISNEGSIGALNRRYGKNIDAKKAIVVKPKEIDPFLKVNSNFLAQSEESAQQMLEKNFKGMGFTFEQTGAGGDYIKVTPNNGAEPQIFSFNNVGNSTRGAFSSPTGMGIGNNNSEELKKNADQSVKLQSYLRLNASAENEDDLSPVNRIKNNISIREKKYDLSPLEKNNEYYNTEDYKNNFKELTFQQKKQEIKRRVDENASLSASYGKGVLGDIYASIFGEDEKYYKTEKDLKKLKNKLNSSEEYKLFISEEKKYNEQQKDKYGKLYDELSIATQSGNKEAIKTAKAKIGAGFSKEVIGDNLNNMTGHQYDLQRSINDFNKRKEKLELDAKNGNLTQEQYNDAVEGLSSEAQRLDVAAKNVAATQKKMNVLAGIYATEKAKSGGFFGNFTNSLLVGVDELISSDGLSGKKQRQQDEIEIKSQDITPQQRQYYKDKGYNDEQIKNVFINNAQKNAIAANKRAIIETFGSDLTTEESKQNLGFVEQALVGVAASLPSMALSLIPVVGQAAAFGGMANMSYNAINEEMLNDTDFETTSEGDRAIVAIPYAVVMGALEKVGMNKMLKGESTIGKIVLSRIAKIIPKGATREVIENIANKEVKSLVAKGALKVIGGTLAEAETGALQAGLLDVGLKQLYNKLDLLDLKLTNKEGLTGGELFETPDTKMGVAGAILEGAAAEAIGGFAMSTVMVGAQGLINGKISLYNKEDLKFFEDFTSDQEFKKLITSNLKTQMLNGTMTKGEAQSALNDIDLVEGVFNSIDENISDEAKIIAFNLINERNRLEKEVIGKDPALSKEKNDRIKDINDKLGTLPLQVLVVNNVERATKLENALKQKGAVIIDGETINRKAAQTELDKINQKVSDAERKQEEDAIKASIPEEISSLKDDEPFTKTVKTLEEIPEEFRDRAKKSTSKGTITTREKILGLPIGKKITTEVDYGYTYTLTGKEAKDYAIQEQAAGQVPVQPTTTVGEEVVQREPTTEPQVLTEEGKAEEVAPLTIQEELQLIEEEKAKTPTLEAPVIEAPVVEATPQEKVATYRAEEQAELLKAIPKIESYKVKGKVDKTKMPRTVLAKYNKIYEKYDALISPLLEPVVKAPVVKAKAPKAPVVKAPIVKAEAPKAKGELPVLSWSNVDRYKDDVIMAMREIQNKLLTPLLALKYNTDDTQKKQIIDIRAKIALADKILKRNFARAKREQVKIEKEKNIKPTTKVETTKAKVETVETKPTKISLRDYKTKEVRGNELKVGDIYVRDEGGQRYVYKLLETPRVDRSKRNFFIAEVELMHIGDYNNEDAKKYGTTIKNVGDKSLDTFKSSRANLRLFGNVKVIENWEKVSKAEPVTEVKAEAPKVETGGASVGIKQQIESFGAPQEDVAAIQVLLEQMFSGLKNAGLTVVKTLEDWVGVGKGIIDKNALKQIIGEIGAENFPKAKANLQVANDMELENKNAKDIRIATGWERGVDGKWRYEIPDNIPYFKDTVRKIKEFLSQEKDGNNIRKKASYFLPPEIMKLYPQLDDVDISFSNKGDKIEGRYYPLFKTITINIGVNSMNTVSTLLHELQHAIQDIEGFGSGGNIELIFKKFVNQEKALIFRIKRLESYKGDNNQVAINKAKQDYSDFVNNFSVTKDGKKILNGFNLYNRINGEVEARNVQARMDMTPEQRSQTLLSETEDVAKDSQIFVINGKFDTNRKWQPLFKDAQAQYRIESGKNIIESIKDFGKSKNKAEATVALTHEIMHPTVVAIIDGAKERNRIGLKHTETIVSEFNKANPDNKITVDELIKGNNDFKNGITSDHYRDVQEFIAESWEQYHTEGGKGFSEAFQRVLGLITKSFQSVYKSISGKELTPELIQMFDEILGKESKVEPVKEEAKVAPVVEEVVEVEQYQPITIEKIFNDRFSKENAISYDEEERETDNGRMSTYISSITMDVTNEDGDSIGTLTKLVDEDRIITWNGEDFDGNQLSEQDFDFKDDARQAIVDKWNKEQKKNFDREAKKKIKDAQKAKEKADKAAAKEEAKSASVVKKEEAPAPAKESTDDLMGAINSIKEDIEDTTKEIEDARKVAREKINKIREEILDLKESKGKEGTIMDLEADIKEIEDILKDDLDGLKLDLDRHVQALKEEVKKLGDLDAKAPENKKTLLSYLDAAIKTLNGLNSNNLLNVKVDVGFTITKWVTVGVLKKILQGIRAGVIAGNTINASIRAMAKEYRSEHKNKKITIDEFTKEIEEYLRNTFVDQKKKTNEQDIQEARDKFVEIREAVRKAKVAVKTESKALRANAENAIREILKGKVKNLTAVQMKSIMLRLARFNVFSQTQYDKFIDYVDKVIGIADYDAKVAKANENRKTAKKNLPKLGDISSDLLDPLSRVLSINAKLIPSDVFESYAEIVEMLSKRDAVLKLNKRADLNESLDKIIESIESNEQRISDLKDLYDSFAGKTADYAETLDEMLKVGIINQSEHKLMKTFKSKIQGPKVKDKMTEQQIADEKAELINEINNTTITLDEIVGNEFRLERDLVKRLQDLLKNKKTLENLNNKDLKDLLRVIDNINNGFVSNATQEMVEKLNFIEKSILLESSIPETFKVITARINQSLEKRISKRINVAPLFNIDQQLGDFKTKNIFNSVFNESAKAQQGYQSAITLIQDELDKIERGIATSFENEPNKIILSQFKMMVYMMQLEYDSNPNNNQVHQAMKTLDETIKFAKQNSEKSGYNNLDIAQMESIKKEFEKDGEIDIDKLYNSFNEAEKNGLNKLQEINDRMTKFATYTATVINGNKIKSLKNYISYTVINESDILSASETTDQINNINANMQPGTVSKNLEERDGKAHPVYLNPFYATNSSSRSVLLNYHMTEPVRTARKTLRNTKTLLEEKKGTTKEQYDILNAITSAYNTATKDLLESNFTQSSKTLEFLKRQGYRAMLASGTRAAAELSSNVIFVLANNKFDMARGLSKQIINIEAVDRKSIMTNLGATVSERLYPTSSINSPFVELTTNKNRSSKSKNTQTGIRNGVIQAWDETAKKYVLMPVAGLADYVISKPDQLVMRPLWFGAFSRAFEKEAGIKPDFDKIMENNEEYMDKYKDALEKATTVADKQVITSGSSTNAYMGILQNVVRQDDKGGIVAIKEFNRFMNKFTVQEYYTAREGVRALVGNGSISRSDGAHLLAAVTLRMTSYFLFTRLFSEGLAVVARSLGFGGDDDDDDKTAKQKISQGILSSITTLVFGRYFGNFIRVAENALIELANKEYGEAIGLRDGEYDPYEDAIQFNQLQEGKIDEPTDFFKIIAGPLAPLIGVGELTFKLGSSVVNPPKTERARLTKSKEWYRRLPLEIGGQLGVVPFYKDFRKIVLEGVYKELKEEVKEKAVKTKAKEIKTALTDSQKTISLKEMMNSGEYTREGIKKELRKIKDPEYRKALKDKDDAIRKKILDKYGYENLTDFKRNDEDNYEIEFGDDSPYRIERAESAKIANELEKRLNALEDGEEYYSTEGTAIVAPKKRANKYNRFESRTKVNRYNRFESVKKVNKYNRFE